MSGLLNQMDEMPASDTSAAEEESPYFGPRLIDRRVSMLDAYGDPIPGKTERVVVGADDNGDDIYEQVLGVPSNYPKAECNAVMIHVRSLVEACNLNLESSAVSTLFDFLNDSIVVTTPTRAGRQATACNVVLLQECLTSRRTAFPAKNWVWIAQWAAFDYTGKTGTMLEKTKCIELLRAAHRPVSIPGLVIPPAGVRATKGKKVTAGTSSVLIPSGPVAGSYGFDGGDVEQVTITDSAPVLEALQPALEPSFANGRAGKKTSKVGK